MPKTKKKFFKGDDLSKKKMDSCRDGARYEKWEREYRRKGKEVKSYEEFLPLNFQQYIENYMVKANYGDSQKGVDREVEFLQVNSTIWEFKT